MALQRILFEPDTLMSLLTAYYDGRVPMDAKVKSVGISQHFNQWVGVMVESDQWDVGDDIRELTDGQHPLFLRYEGRHNMAWSKADGVPITWGDEGEQFEVPK
jgi:hypothetical protein